MGKLKYILGKRVLPPSPSQACPFALAVRPGQPKHAPHNLE